MMTPTTTTKKTTKTKTTKIAARYTEAVGRRKTSVARVRITPNPKQELVINNLAFGDYFHIADLFSTYVFVFFVLLFINVTMAVFIVSKWQSEFTEVTTSGIMKYSGILYKKVDKYACNFVEVVTIAQSFLGMVFNYGTLELYDPSLKEKIYLLNISGPKKHSKLIEGVIKKKTESQIPFVTS